MRLRNGLTLQALEVTNNLFTPRIANVLGRGGRNPCVWHMVAQTTQQRLVALRATTQLVFFMLRRHA